MILTAEKLRSSKCGLVAERDSVGKAFDDAMEMLQAEGVGYMVGFTAINLVANTLLETLARDVEAE